MTESKRLYRARDDRMLAGVCGGLAKYLGVDATIVRVLWVVISLFLAALGGVILYLAMALIVPEEPAASSASAGSAATGEPEARPPVE